MLDWTEERERSATSRQWKGSESSSRVRVLVPEEDAHEVFNSLRISRMIESGLSLFLKGRISSVGSVRRRFLLSAMVEICGVGGKMILVLVLRGLELVERVEV